MIKKIKNSYSQAFFVFIYILYKAYKFKTKTKSNFR